MAMAAMELRIRNVAVGQAAEVKAVEAFKWAPLSDEPFLVAGFRAHKAGKAAEAEALLTEARNRNPRSRAARLILLERYLRTGRVKEAALEVALLTRVMPRSGQYLIPGLARFAEDPKASAALADVLRSNPSMQGDVLEHLAGTGASPDMIIRLANSLPPGTGEEDTRWQRILLSSMIERGDVDRAFAIWARYAGAPASGRKSGLYDGRFEGLPGSPPFNWALVANNAGVAERSKAASLQVEYYGRAPAELATQLLTLQPGKYRLSFRAEGEAKDGGSLNWILSCNRSNQAIQTVKIQNVTYAPRVIAGEFVIPAGGCPAQWLKLLGTPSEFPDTQSVAISDMRIDRARS
jgi:hypothetical protein